MKMTEDKKVMTGQARRFRSRYEDIIGLPYPPKDRDMAKHPPMSAADRAKIFAPFAALKGYEEAIAAKIGAHGDENR